MRGALGHVIYRGGAASNAAAPFLRLYRLVQQHFRSNFQSLRDAHHNEQARIASAALDAADISQVDACFEGKLLLGQPSRLAQPSHIPANDAAPVRHRPMSGARAYNL